MRRIKDEYRQYKENEKVEALFMFQAGTVWASLDSVYRSMKADSRFEVRLVLIEETTVDTSHMLCAKKFLDDYNYEYQLYQEIDFNVYIPHIVFVQFPYDAAMHTPETLSLQFKRRGTRVVYVPYGIEIADTDISRKDHFNSFVVENSWRIYTCCDGIKREYDKYCRNRSAVRVCGSPKFDAISYKNEFPIDEQIKLSSRGRKLIVWKMHFPKKIYEKGEVKQITPYVQEYIEFAKKIERYSDLFFVIVAHPKMLRGVVASDIQGDDTLMEQVFELFEVLKKQENAFVDTSDEYRNSFYHADAIIMDRSALMIEAGLLNVPVLLMRNKDYSEIMTKSVNDVVSTYYQGTDYEDMCKYVEMLQQGKDLGQNRRSSAVLKEFPYTDGKCGERIREDIVASLKEKYVKPKVIVYGTGEICRYYMGKQNWKNSEKFILVAAVDSNNKKWGQDYYTTSIISPEELKNTEFDAIVITTEPHYFEIKKNLVYDLFVDERKIWRIDEFVVALENMV